MRTKSRLSNSDARAIGMLFVGVALAVLPACRQTNRSTATATPIAATPSDAGGSSAASIRAPQAGVEAANGPFGLAVGMNEQALRAATSKLTRIRGAYFTSESVPKPHSAFESYGFILTEKQGLCKISATGVDIEINAFGTQVKEQFETLLSALSEKYGKYERYDMLRAGSIWNEPGDWAMGLAKEERVLAASWTFSPTRTIDSIQAIALQAKALSSSKAYLSLMYDFDTTAECIKDAKRSENAVF
jgi:hypothetical protein